MIDNTSGKYKYIYIGSNDRLQNVIYIFETDEKIEDFKALELPIDENGEEPVVNGIKGSFVYPYAQSKNYYYILFLYGGKISKKEINIKEYFDVYKLFYKEKEKELKKKLTTKKYKLIHNISY
jgi:hypothetical protein